MHVFMPRRLTIHDLFSGKIDLVLSIPLSSTVSKYGQNAVIMQHLTPAVLSYLLYHCLLVIIPTSIDKLLRKANTMLPFPCIMLRVYT